MVFLRWCKYEELFALFFAPFRDSKFPARSIITFNDRVPRMLYLAGREGGDGHEELTFADCVKPFACNFPPLLHAVHGRCNHLPLTHRGNGWPTAGAQGLNPGRLSSEPGLEPSGVGIFTLLPGTARAWAHLERLFFVQTPHVAHKALYDQPLHPCTMPFMPLLPSSVLLPLGPDTISHPWSPAPAFPSQTMLYLSSADCFPRGVPVSLSLSY